MMNMEEFDYGNGKGKLRRRRRMIYGGVALTVLLVCVIVISVVVPKKKNASSSAYGSIAPEDQELFSMIESTLIKEGVSVDSMLLKDAYQYKAFQWLADNSNRDAYDHSQLLQRFALACFYYATYNIETLYTPDPDPWESEDGWMSDEHECSWHGIVCTGRLKVSGINLEDNGLTGALPMELVLLKDQLTFLALSSNLIYMESDQLDVLGLLYNLQTLLMDDNYLSTGNGLPDSLIKCTELQKIRLSYNLLGGQLSGNMLTTLTKLTHLEVESNFLSGSLPAVVGDMSQLVYLYMRRNALRFNLDFLKRGGLTNLFAMWIDSNDVRGTIPTEIGLLTEMASLSITNSSLTGTIPTEIGNLSGLRRLWLYSNKLKGTIPTQMTALTILEVLEVYNNSLGGTMPTEICNSVESSIYEQKSLTADCSKVSCQCCTECP